MCVWMSAACCSNFSSFVCFDCQMRSWARSWATLWRPSAATLPWTWRPMAVAGWWGCSRPGGASARPPAPSTSPSETLVQNSGRKESTLLISVPGQTGTTSLSSECFYSRKKIPFRLILRLRLQDSLLVGLVCSHEQLLSLATQRFYLGNAACWNAKNVAWFGISFVSATSVLTRKTHRNPRALQLIQACLLTYLFSI